jgi:hypothetical protein
MDRPAEKLADDLDNLPEAEFLDVTGTKVLSVFLLAIHSYLY